MILAGQGINKKTQLFTVLFLFSFCNLVRSQGLINNGARIMISPGTSVFVNGGLALGNFTNQDAGVFTGTVENQGTMEITGNWNNLSLSNVFIANTGTVMLSGANQQIQGTSATWFNNLTLLGSGVKSLNIATLTGGGYAAPAGLLDLTTLPLDLNGFPLTINNPSTAAIATTGGYIISETPAAINPSIVQWNMGATNGLYVYPFGVAGTPIPFTLDKTAGNGNVSVSTRATGLSDNTPWQASVTNMYSAMVAGPGEVPVVIDRWWDVAPSAPVTGQLSFTYRGSENTTTYNPTGTFSAQNWNGLQWLAPVGAGPGVLVGTAAVTTPSLALGTTPWVLSNLAAPLPVQLISFTGYCDTQTSVQLLWSTATETGNMHFTLEKSQNGHQYTRLASIPASGNSTSVQNYSFTDTEPYAGKAIYRLSQTDLNGRMEYFSPIAVQGCNTATNGMIKVWSTNGVIHLQLNSHGGASCEIMLYDLRGRLVRHASAYFESGISEETISTRFLSRGMYYLAVKSSMETGQYKVLIGE